MLKPVNAQCLILLKSMKHENLIKLTWIYAKNNYYFYLKLKLKSKQTCIAGDVSDLLCRSTVLLPALSVLVSELLVVKNSISRRVKFAPEEGSENQNEVWRSISCFFESCTTTRRSCLSTINQYAFISVILGF